MMNLYTITEYKIKPFPFAFLDDLIKKLKELDISYNLFEEELEICIENLDFKKISKKNKEFIQALKNEAKNTNYAKELGWLKLTWH